MALSEINHLLIVYGPPVTFFIAVTAAFISVEVEKRRERKSTRP